MDLRPPRSANLEVPDVPASEPPVRPHAAPPRSGPEGVTVTCIQRLTLATVIVLVAATVAVVAFLALRGPGRSVDAATSGYADQPTLGDADAPVKVILFENFLCDHCRAFEEDAFPRLVTDYIDQGLVEAYYVNLAWGGERARQAALAGECAYRQDETGFWAFKSRLYRAQNDWSGVEDLVELARGVDGLDADALRSCVVEERYADEVQRDLDLAERVGVQGTPSVIVGDEGFQAPAYPGLAAAIDARLAAR